MDTKHFAETYNKLLGQLWHKGTDEINERTGTNIKTLRGGTSFKVDLETGRLPVAGNRKYWPKIAAVETAWQIMGTQDPTWIVEKAPKLWSNFVEDGKLKTAYGYRWRHHFGRDQLSLAIHALNRDPSNRQIWVQAWDPAVDGLGEPDQPKNIPCPIGFSLSVVGEELHMSLFIRSSDVFVGLPYDVMGYAMTLDAIAATMELKPGTMHVTLAHPHIYGAHYEYVEQCLKDRTRYAEDIEQPLPNWTIPEIAMEPDRYVEFVNRGANRMDQHDYSPLPELIL